jgi:hypothetical protein
MSRRRNTKHMSAKDIAMTLNSQYEENEVQSNSFMEYPHITNIIF